MLEVLSDFQVTIPELGTIDGDAPADGLPDLERHARPVRGAQAALPLPPHRLPDVERERDDLCSPGARGRRPTSPTRSPGSSPGSGRWISRRRRRSPSRSTGPGRSSCSGSRRSRPPRRDRDAPRPAQVRGRHRQGPGRAARRDAGRTATAPSTASGEPRRPPRDRDPRSRPSGCSGACRGSSRPSTTWRRELDLTNEELLAVLAFLTEVGQADEFMLLSDVLGLSRVVDDQTHAGDAGTDSAVLGPFYRPGAPWIDNPGRLAAPDEPGQPADASAAGSPTRRPERRWPGRRRRVARRTTRRLLERGCRLDPFNLRGRQRTDADGRYDVETVVPVPYQVKNDGPVGKLLGRSIAMPGGPPTSTSRSRPTATER